jgi:selenide, water dikinase
MGPGDLAKLLEGLPHSVHPDLLLAPDHGADAGVMRVALDLAIIQTADFFPPMVADARAFGRIAAANALSDIYAVGGRPVGAVNLLATPRNEPVEGLRAMMSGAYETVTAAGAVMLGGHTLVDTTVKFGLAVTGVVHPDHIVPHNTPQIDDVLVLTKPLGTAVALTAYDRNLLNAGEYNACIEQMCMLNRLASELMLVHEAHAATDITGFGLLVHALDMISLGAMGLDIESESVPYMPRVEELINAGAICGGTKRNMEYSDNRAGYNHVPGWLQVILNDAQTSGGLLIALAEDHVQPYIDAMREAGYPWSVAAIGRVVSDHPGTINVT